MMDMRHVRLANIFLTLQDLHITPGESLTVVSKMASSTQFSDFKNFIKMNKKIPHYAREYKKEYLYIRGLNKEFKYIIDFMEDDDNEFKSHKLDRIMKFIKRFLRAQENGRLKDISNLEFNYDDVYNIIELIRNLPEYFYLIQHLYDWSRDDDESLISRYEIYKDDLELFLSKLNIEIEYSDSDSDSDDF